MFLDATKRSSTTLFLLGGIAIIYGLTSSLWPGLTVFAFVTMWGIYALIDGAGALFAAFSDKEGRAWHLGIGVLGVLAGVVAVFRPGVSVAVVAWILGIWLLVRGVSEIISSFSAPKIGQKVPLFLAGMFWGAAGVVTLLNPLSATVSWAFWLGILAIGWGLVTVFAGFGVRRSSRAR